MMAQVQLKAASGAPVGNPVVGDVLLAQFGFDNLWYRAEIKGEYLMFIRPIYRLYIINITNI